MKPLVWQSRLRPSPIPGTSAALPLSLLPCRRQGNGTHRAEPRWLGKHHAPPLCIKEAPNMPLMSYGKCGTALQQPQASPWGSGDLKYPLFNLLLHPANFVGLRSLLRLEVLFKERCGGPSRAPLQAAPHPPTHLCKQRLPLLPMEAKRNTAPGCGAAQLTGRLACPRRGLARKDLSYC